MPTNVGKAFDGRPTIRPLKSRISLGSIPEFEAFVEQCDDITAPLNFFKSIKILSVGGGRYFRGKRRAAIWPRYQSVTSHFAVGALQDQSAMDKVLIN